MKKVPTLFIISLFVLSCPVSLAAQTQLDGKAIVARACSKCHSLSRIESASKDTKAWESTVDRMIKKGATVNEEERAAVLTYLRTLMK